MGWRSELENKYTVSCKKCGHEIVDPSKKPAQKYIQDRCPACGYDKNKLKRDWLQKRLKDLADEVKAAPEFSYTEYLRNLYEGARA